MATAFTRPVIEDLRATDRRHRWSVTQTLALIGLPILLIEADTLGRWLADGPHQITRYRSHGSSTWYAAHTLEALTALASLFVVAIVVRDCRRRRRILTFDVMFCLAGATMFWADSACNFFQPTFLVSSDFVNLNNPCGHMPLVVNPDCGGAPDPTLWLWMVETFGILGAAMVVGSLLRRVAARRGGLSTGRLVGVALLSGIVLDLLLEPAMIALGLWTYPLPKFMSLPLGHDLRYPLAETFCGGLWFGSLIAVRTVRDDSGRTLVERGLDHLTIRRRAAVSMLALYAFFQLSIWCVASMPLWFLGPYEPAWHHTPADIVNGICDVPGSHSPGTSGSHFGPCPGSPGYRIPIRQTL
jgi:Spirocyclase AveC-like